jgi:hypothetical protein
MRWVRVFNVTPTSTTTAFKNSHLSATRSAKNDEFYTQWADIEREMNAYHEYDPAAVTEIKSCVR